MDPFTLSCSAWWQEYSVALVHGSRGSPHPPPHRDCHTGNLRWNSCHEKVTEHFDLDFCVCVADYSALPRSVEDLNLRNSETPDERAPFPITFLFPI